MSLSVWCPKRTGLPQAMASERRDAIEAALCEHFEAMRELMRELGHGPVQGLELRMLHQAFDSDVAYRWEPPRV